MKAPLRVAMIIQSYVPRLGGAERQLRAVASRMAARGVELHIITRRYPGFAAFEHIDGIPVHRMPIIGPKPVASLLFTLSALLLLRRLRPNLIHAHELLSPTTTAIAAKRLWGTPVVAKVLRGGTLGDIAKLHRSKVSATRVPVLLSKVDAFVVISQEIERELEANGIPAERRHFIPNGVDTGRFAPLPTAERQSMRDQLGMNGAPTAVFSGRLSAEKGLGGLVRAWPQVRATAPGAELVILGAGDEEADLRAAAGEGIRFAGYVENVVGYLQAADAFVLPSQTEGLSNALLEAMAVGLPVAATAVGGAPDVISHGKNGLLVPPDAPHEMAQTIGDLLRDPAAREALGAEARRRIECEYSLPVTVDRLLTLYERLEHE